MLEKKDMLEQKTESEQKKHVSEQKNVSDKGKKKVVGTLCLKKLSNLKEAIDAQPHPVKEEVIDLEEDEIQVTSISQPVVVKMLSNNVKYLEQLHALIKQ